MPAQRAFWKRLGIAFVSLTLALAAFSPLAGAPRAAHAAGPYVVDTILDFPDAANDGACNDGLGHCTLRAAIQQAFNDIGPTTITFSNALTGSTFALSDLYGTILWAGQNITVTGENKNITISGENLTGSKSVIEIDGSHNLLENVTVRQATLNGVDVGDFSGLGFGSDNTLANVTLLQNHAAGVYVYGGGSGGGQRNTIQNSRLGSASTTSCGFGNDMGVFIDQGAMATTVEANYIFCNTGAGIQIANSTNSSVSGNAIGTYYNAQLGNGGDGINASGATGLYLVDNWISANSGDGILLANSTQALIQANLIGTNPYASAANPNGGNGIELNAGSNQNVVGGLALVDRNTISGNGLSGVLLDGSGTQTNTVVGNYIGTNLTGTAAIANGLNGVRLQNDTNSNTIGGHGSTNMRNLISGNALDGVLLTSGATQNYVEGNFIGLGVIGLTAIPNHLGGVGIFNAPFNFIGPGYPNTSQYISGNLLQGIDVGASDLTQIGADNSIGVAADNVTPLGNGQAGVYVNESIDVTVVPHAVLYNGGSGVVLAGADSHNDKLAPAYVAFNGGLPIDLGDDGATANDPGDGDGGPNTLLNYPVITSYAGSVITGTVCASCTVLIYNAYGNPAGNYGGGFYVQSATANGAGQWSAVLVGGLHRLDVSLVACQSPCGGVSNTSEMSPRPRLFLPLARR